MSYNTGVTMPPAFPSSPAAIFCCHEWYTVRVPPHMHRFCVLCSADFINPLPMCNRSVDNIMPPSRCPACRSCEKCSRNQGVIWMIWFKKRNIFARKAVVNSSSCTGHARCREDFAMRLHQKIQAKLLGRCLQSSTCFSPLVSLFCVLL